MLILFFFLCSLSLYSMNATELAKLSVLCEQNIIKNFEDYDHNDLVTFLSADLQVPLKEVSEDFQEKEQQIDFITLAFHSAIANRYQNLVLKIAHTIPNELKCKNFNHIKKLTLPQKWTIIDQIKYIFDQTNHIDLISPAIQTHQNEIAKKLISREKFTKKEKKELFLESVEYNNIEIAKFSLQLGVSINEIFKSGQNALHYAALYNCKEMAKFLLDKGIDTSLLSLQVEGVAFNPLDFAICGKGWGYGLWIAANYMGKYKELESNFEEKKEICTVIAPECSLETLQHSYHKSFGFLSETSPIKVFLKEQMKLKEQK